METVEDDKIQIDIEQNFPLQDIMIILKGFNNYNLDENDLIIKNVLLISQKLIVHYIDDLSD